MSADLPPRVLLVTGPASGGLKRHVETLADRLPGLGYQVASAAPVGVFTGIEAGFRLDLGDRPRPGPDLQALRQLRAAAASWRPDLIHAHGVKAALLTLLAFTGKCPPVVVTYHNRWLGGPLTLPLRLLAGRARASIAVADAVRDSLTVHGVRPEPLVVIRNGIDPSVYSPRPVRQPGPFTLLFIGRLTEEKGIPLLLEAVTALEASEKLPLRLLIAGDGPLRPDVEAAARRSGSSIEFLGPQSDVLPVYHQADAVLMPSRSEGLPMAALEAMACALPVVAARVGGLPELVADGETGVLLSPGSVSELVRACRDLADRPGHAAELGRAGRQRVERQFTETGMLEALAKVYREVLPGCAG
jgi:glycosyltransferase involved in cell wall biosynthesis